MNRLLLWASYCVFLVVLFSPSLDAKDWSQWRGDDRANRSSETGLFENWGADGPPLEWIAEGLGNGYANVSVVGDRIYTSGNFDNDQAVVAINAVDGKLIWKTPFTTSKPEHGYEGSRTTPTIDEDRLYVVSSDGRIACMSTADGKLVWSRGFSEWGGKMMSSWGFSESPLIDGDKVICTPGGPDGMLVALDKMTGKEIWASTVPQPTPENEGGVLNEGAGYSSAIISAGGGVKQYVQLVGRGLLGVRASDGKLLWQYNRVANSVANIPTAIIDGDFVFTSTGYNTGSALLKLSSDGSGGVKAEEIYWLKGRTLQNKHGGMTLVDGYIYCGHGNGNGMPICIEMASGEIMWGPERTEGKGETSLIYADGHIIYRREDGTILLTQADPKSFKVLGSFKQAFQEGNTWAHPVIANGMLYLREQNKLMCYKLK